MDKLNTDRISILERNKVYINKMRPVLNKRALFSDMTQDYLSPAQPNSYSIVKVRFRAAKNNIDRVFCVCRDEKILMYKLSTTTDFDYYETEIELDDAPVEYHFEIVVGHIVCYYDIRGVVKRADKASAFCIMPGFRTPEWARGAVMYQIFVDRFYNGDKTNDVLTNEYYYINKYSARVENWDKYPDAMGVGEFYGGDLQGVMDKLDYLKDLGIEAIYFNPLFVSPSNHKYDIQDYDYIDPHIGVIVQDEGELLAHGDIENRHATRYINRVTKKENLEASNQLFIKLVEEAHKRGIRVIIDGVFNHCGSFNKWMDRERIYENQGGYEKGAYISEDSPYHSFFRFWGNHFPYNASYDGWWGHNTLPKLNYEGSRELMNYILEIGRKWVSPPYNCDGWRLDVAADLGQSPEFNHEFWKEFRRTVKEANSEAIIIAEHYGDPKAWLNGEEWDTVMNYDAFMEPITWFLTGMQKHSDDYRHDMLGNADAFCGAIRHHYSNLSFPAVQISMNELSNHDHSRFLTRTNRKKGRMNTLGCEAAEQGVRKEVFREAVVFQMTWPGAPTIYYGDEAGLCGFTDPDNRRTYPWGREDHELIRFHKEMIRIHKENQELRTGSMKFLKCSYNVISFARFTREEQTVVLINNNDHEVEITFTLWEAGIDREGILRRLMLTDDTGFTTKAEEYIIHGGFTTIKLPKTSAMVLKSVKKNLAL